MPASLPDAVPTPRTVLVTGASRGIGAAIAHQFVAAGTNLAILVRQQNNNTRALAEACSAVGATFVLLECDLTDGDRVDRLVNELIGQYPVDVLVNNAAMVKDGLALRLDLQDYEAVMAVNFFAAVRLTKLCLKSMLKRRFGRVVQISSLVATRGNGGQSPYAAAKAALNGYTRSAAKEMASRGITVNAVAPGFIASDMTRDLRPEWLTKIEKEIPLRRLGRAAEVAEVVHFLASNEASYITGQIIDVCGGL